MRALLLIICSMSCSRFVAYLIPIHQSQFGTSWPKKSLAAIKLQYYHHRKFHTQNLVASTEASVVQKLRYNLHARMKESKSTSVPEHEPDYTGPGLIASCSCHTFQSIVSRMVVLRAIRGCTSMYKCQCANANQETKSKQPPTLIALDAVLVSVGAVVSLTSVVCSRCASTSRSSRSGRGRGSGGGGGRQSWPVRVVPQWVRNGVVVVVNIWLAVVSIVQEVIKDDPNVKVIQARIGVPVSHSADAKTGAIGVFDHLDLQLVASCGLKCCVRAKVSKDAE